MTITTSPFQLGEPVEHRGIVITPLFPRRDPIAAYVTLDEALPRGLAISETTDAGSVPELAVVNPLDEHVLLYDGEELVGAKQNRILNVSVLVAPERRCRSPSPASSRALGAHARSTSTPRAHLPRPPAAPEGGDARRAAARPRRRAGRGVGRGSREGRPHGASTRRPAPTPTRSRRTRTRLRALEDAFPIAAGPVRRGARDR